MPPAGENRKIGIWLEKPMAPSSTEEPVIRYTSHAWATFCIQVPISEIDWPAKKSWKLRYCKARSVAGSFIPLIFYGTRTLAHRVARKDSMQEACGVAPRGPRPGPRGVA